MKKLTIVVCMSVLALLMAGPAGAYVYQDNFETAWTGNYAPGWDNEGYRHGDAPVAFMQQTSTHYGSGSSGVKVIADSVPAGWEWWAVVYNTNVITSAMAKQYDPYIKVNYYDEVNTSTARAGQLYAVPNWVVDEDWTDVQFGARINRGDNYYFVSKDLNGSDWVDTGVARTAGWHELKLQLSSADGYLHFYIDGFQVGLSNRNDLENLGTGMLSVMFNAPLSDWGTDNPFAIYDNFEVGSTSTVPLPGTLMLLGSGLAGLGLIHGRKFIKR